MSRTPIIVGNWKLNKTLDEAKELARALASLVGQDESVEVGVAPVFTCLAAVHGALRGSKVLLGAQDCYSETTGAYTGEVSAPFLLDVGCSFAIIGHSERRALFGDTDDVVAAKVRGALDGGLHVIACVGETEAEREDNRTTQRVGAQLAALASALTESDLANLVIAYEPVWAIGTGKTATPAQAQEVHAFIRTEMSKRFGEAGANVRIQYGGSVKPSNAAELLSQPDIDGALVGGASLVADDFAAIVAAAR